MKNIKIWKIFGTKLVSFCLSAMCVVATSCGHRKTEISKTEIKKDTLISLLSERKVKVDSNYTFDFSTFKIYPIDFTKPIIINGSIIQNASIEGTKKIESGSLQKNIGVKEIEIKKGSSYSVEKTKQTEKSDYTILWALIVFIISGFIFLWFYLPKIKNL